MKVRSKDEIIKCLIDILSETIPEEQRLVEVWEGDSMRTYYIDTGWIESLMWTLGLTEEEKSVFKYSEEDIISAVDIAVGDDGRRSKEVIEILKTEVYASDRNETN